MYLAEHAAGFMGKLQLEMVVDIKAHRHRNPGANRVRIALVAPVEDCVTAAERIRNPVHNPCKPDGVMPMQAAATLTDRETKKPRSCAAFLCMLVKMCSREMATALHSP